MKVLVACEESQVVCNAFRTRGHEAYSLDLLPTRGTHPEWHIQTDICWYESAAAKFNYDLMIAHVPCDTIANSGVRWLFNEDGTRNQIRWADLRESTNLFKYLLYDFPVDRVVIENPIPHKYAVERIGVNYGQLIQPWQFGHMEEKATCFWLKHVPPLEETNNVYDDMMKLPKKERQKVHYMSPSDTRPRDRAVTFQGIADAMAEQWGSL
jgi:hypothetical protein